MPVYRLTSDNNVTKDTAPFAGSPFADNDAALQAIKADPYLDGDTIEFEEVGGVKFNTLNGGIGIKQSIAFKGIKVGGVRPTWDAPDAFYMTWNEPTKDFSWEDIDILDSNCPVFPRQTRDLTVKNMKGTNGESKSLAVDFGGGQKFASYWFSGTGSVPTAINGDVLFENVEVEFEADADPLDPYAGIHTDIDPANWTPGSSPFVSGTQNAVSWLTQGPIVQGHAAGKKLEMVNCITHNYSDIGLGVINCRGNAHVHDNEVTTPYGGHGSSRPSGSIAIAMEALQGDLALYGTMLCEDNALNLNGVDLMGLFSMGRNGSRWRSLTTRRNKITATAQILHFIRTSGCRSLVMMQDVLEGPARRALKFGRKEDARGDKTDLNLISEDLTKVTVEDAHVWFNADARQNTASLPGLTSATVIDEGLENSVMVA